MRSTWAPEPCDGPRAVRDTSRLRWQPSSREVSRAENADAVTVVLIPEYVPRHWWDRILYNQNAHRIREALVGRHDIVVLDVPYRREEADLSTS